MSSLHLRPSNELARGLAIVILVLAAGFAHAGDQDTGDKPNFAIKEDGTGTHLGARVVRNLAVPPDKSYAELTPSEKEAVKSAYDKMPEADEPPYPLAGTKRVLEASRELSRRYRPEGLLSLVVDVDEKGNATAVSALASPDTEFTKAVATVLMLQKYKPAVCSGQPCKMQYPFRMNYLGPTAIN